MGIIRSMWFRDEEEIADVKELLAKKRGTNKPGAHAKRKTIPTKEPVLPEDKQAAPAPKVFRKPLLPQFLMDVMNGLSYPNQEDLTREEQQILYDPAINGLVNEYRATKSPATALLIEERLKEIRG